MKTRRDFLKASSLFTAGLVLRPPWLKEAIGNVPGTVRVIMPGDYADPTILCDGNDYYLTHSSYKYYPGLLIWHSKDLLNWKPVTRALHRYVGDVWAPELVKYKSRYYIYFPADGDIYVITAEHMAGPWSDPVKIGLEGIDPGHITDGDGKRYLFIDNGRYVRLADDGLSVEGVVRKVYDGWHYPADWAVECYCLESPKLTYWEGYFYLTVAQGGTAGPATSHMAVSARAHSLEGPWENSPYNPIVHTYNKEEAFLSKGHGTVFRDAAGGWHIVYHAYKKGAIPLGRHTLLEPLEWTKDGWFKKKAQGAADYVIINNTRPQTDSFSGFVQGLQWSFSGVKSADDYHFDQNGVTVRETADQIKVLHCIAADRDYEATVRLYTDGGMEVGLAAFYDVDNFAGLSIRNNKLTAVTRNNHYHLPAIDAVKIHYLRIRLENFNLTLSYSEDAVHWTTYPSAYEISGYQHNMLGGFSSLKIGIYWKGAGTAVIRDFVYTHLK